MPNNIDRCHTDPGFSKSSSSTILDYRLWKHTTFSEHYKNLAREPETPCLKTMSDNLIPPASSTTVAPLKDLYDYEYWAQTFQIACQYKGIWPLFTGDERILSEPDASKYEQHVLTAPSDSVVHYWQNRENCDYGAWERQGLKIQHAMAFLGESLSPEIRGKIQACMPDKAWTALWSAYGKEKQGHLHTRTPTPEPEDVYLKDCKDMNDYLTRLDALHAQSIHDGSAHWGLTKEMVKILAGLPPQFLQVLSRQNFERAISEAGITAMKHYLLRCEADTQHGNAALLSGGIGNGN